MVTVSVSLESARPASISRAMALSSLPVTSDTSRVGASATPVTSTVMLSVTVATSSPSADVAVTPRSNDPLKSSAGVIVKPSSWSELSVQVPSPLSVPADSVAPSGTPLIVTVRVSELSARPASMSRAMAESSLPEASETSSVGVSATPSTSTVIEPVEVATSDPSVEVAVTPRSNEPLKSSAVVIVKPSSWSELRVQVPSPLSVPADRVAPSGTPLIVTVRVSELSARPASMSRAMAESSLPEASLTSSIGASATPVTSTVMLSVAVATSEPSADVAVTPRSNEPLKSSGGVMLKPSS